jgi:hypothetical protein
MYGMRSQTLNVWHGIENRAKQRSEKKKFNKKNNLNSFNWIITTNKTYKLVRTKSNIH